MVLEAPGTSFSPVLDAPPLLIRDKKHAELPGLPKKTGGIIDLSEIVKDDMEESKINAVEGIEMLQTS